MRTLLTGVVQKIVKTSEKMGSQDQDMCNGYEFCKNYKGLHILHAHHQIKELQTILRDRNTSRSDFKFYADRLIRLVIEDSLNQLPFTDCNVVTPTGATYVGLKYKSGNCGVSIVRSGEAMEQGLRDCCRSIRIGKILVESDSDTHEAKVVYARFPEDICQRHVLLMYPIMSTGNTVSKAVHVLTEHGVEEECIVLSNLFCTPQAVQTVLDTYPKMKISTSEVHPVAPNHFGQKYFGTD
ncbi:uracil phosphoribosyltransferase homolog [Diorhabda sublineata]|uniref:uracil phosphoribosyltransferase homolog n=1 Tax=Diorhabda sublineata TaxID=1163346 RepID=UPI0024E1799B|nr:uracil phosphoribosyltransferase homolog [Diorhabda sublineata]